jgi:hypothetical protein
MMRSGRWDALARHAVVKKEDGRFQKIEDLNSEGEDRCCPGRCGRGFCAPCLAEGAVGDARDRRWLPQRTVD